MTAVRKQKSGDQLSVGDWLAPDEMLPGAAEVMFAYAYPASADGSRDSDGKHVQLVVREQGAVSTYADIVAGNTLFDLASDEDRAAYREAAERAQRIADIRAMADWLEATPGVPVPGFAGQVSPGHETLPHLDVWNCGAEGLAELQRMAALMDAEIVSNDDRSQAVKTFGRSEYRAIAWHRDGRPAEPADAPRELLAIAPGADGVAFALAPAGAVVDDETRARVVELTEAVAADPTGMAYSRTDDDPQPTAGRGPLHTGAVTDEGLDERCVICGESLRDIARGTLGHIPGEICNPVDLDADDEPDDSCTCGHPDCGAC